MKEDDEEENEMARFTGRQAIGGNRREPEYCSRKMPRQSYSNLDHSRSGPIWSALLNPDPEYLSF